MVGTIVVSQLHYTCWLCTQRGWRSNNLNTCGKEMCIDANIQFLEFLSIFHIWTNFSVISPAGPKLRPGLITPSFGKKVNGNGSVPRGPVPARPVPQPHPKDEDSLVQMAEHIPAGTRTPMCGHCNMVIRSGQFYKYTKQNYILLLMCMNSIKICRYFWMSDV